MLDDVSDKALETVQAVKGRLEESDAYIQIKERYDSLSPLLQKLVLTAIGLVFAYIFLLLPLSYYDHGSENLALFEENRDLVLDLYRVKRRSLSTPITAPPISTSDLEARARNAVNSARVQAEQVKGITSFDNAGSKSSSFIPKNVTQSGVEIRLANLNLTQIVDIGHALNSSSSSAKIIGLDVKAGTIPGNYFDAIFKIVSFDIPVATAPNSKPTGRKK